MEAKILTMPRPNPKQRLALAEKHRYVGYGGARGGGKSWFVRWKAVLLCLNYPGIKILITRKTYRELLNNHIAPLLSLLAGVARYNKSDKCFTFPNGSTIWFGYCANDTDLGQYQGAEFDIWFADEAGQFPEGLRNSRMDCSHFHSFEFVSFFIAHLHSYSEKGPLLKTQQALMFLSIFLLRKIDMI